jgi:hypothetical protein
MNNFNEDNKHRAVAFQFYPDKWQSHTRRLSDSAYRIYFEMLCWMWQHSDDHYSIDADPDAIACKLAMQTDAVAKAIAEIQNPHAPLLKSSGKRLVSNGLKKEREKQLRRSDLRRNSANHRWNKDLQKLQPQSISNANASSLQCFPTPTPTPPPIPSPTPLNNKNAAQVYPDDFILFWKAYPKKVGKEAALREWKRAKGKPSVDAIIESVNQQKRTDKWQEENGKFIAHPAKWLKEGRWDDEVEVTIEKPKYFED